METSIDVPMFKLLRAVNSNVELSEPQLQLLHGYGFISNANGRVELSDAGVRYLNGISPRLMREPIRQVAPVLHNLSEANSKTNNTSVRAAIYELAKQDAHVLEVLFKSGNTVDSRVLKALIRVYKRAYITGHRAGFAYAYNKKRRT